MKQTGGWVIPDKIKWYILIFLLVVLCAIAFERLMRSSRPNEGFTSTEPIQYLNETTIPPEQQTVSYVIPISSRDNGYYIRRDENGAAKSLVRLPYGYYKVNDADMAKIPSGYALMPQGTEPSTDYLTKIVPKTNTAKYKADPSIIGGKRMLIPASGMPDGYYKIDDTHMATLPDGMKPKIKTVGIIADNNTPIVTTLLEEYDVGFVPESTYYSTKYTVTTEKDVPNSEMYPKNPIRVSGADFPTRPVNVANAYTQLDVWPLPPKLYYAMPPDLNSWTPNVVQYLPYGKIPNKNRQNGLPLPGYIDDPNLISKTGRFDYSNKDYKDIINNYDQVFHDSIDDLKKQNDMYDVDFGSITVIDKDGNLVTLPRSQVQGDITYYQPGSYTFGASSYVPKYEDSVYLSRTSHLPTMAEYRSAYKTVGFCEADKESPNTIEEKCKALDVNACASTSCCVLLGGSKCVSGNETGPTDKSNYSDILLRNKDSYTYMGECYGNCP